MTDHDIAFGLARRADVAPIARLSRDLIEEGLQWSWTPQRVAASLRDRDTLVAVARVANCLAGFGIMRYRDDEAHLDLFGVVPRHRRAGVGRQLLAWLEKPALVAGIGAVFLEVREQNAGAQAFYTRLGYRTLTRLPRYYQGAETALRMGRELGRPPRGDVQVEWPSAGLDP